jgi:hypothetical protein
MLWVAKRPSANGRFTGRMFTDGSPGNGVCAELTVVMAFAWTTPGFASKLKARRNPTV